MLIEHYLKGKRAIIEKALDYFLFKDYPEDNGREEDGLSLLREAMKYSLFRGGKRLRPILVIASTEALGGHEEEVLPAACALEMIHTYSLIHDDLPAMDDDDFRRGSPACHKVYGEAMAILTGDALLTDAFTLLSRGLFPYTVDDKKINSVIYEISKAAGSSGMVRGQVKDLETKGKQVDLPTLKNIHLKKTASLILASVRVGAILAEANAWELEILTGYGTSIGLAFQIRDDLLDMERDSKCNATYPFILGLEGSEEKLRVLIEEAQIFIKDLDNKAQPLREIAKYIGERKD